MYRDSGNMIQVLQPSKSIGKSEICKIISKPLKYVQIFGIMPMCLKRNQMEFSWRCYKTVYTLLLLIIFTAYSIFMLFSAVKEGKLIFSYVGFIWNLRATLGLFALLNLATRWADFVKQWEEMESAMLVWKYLPDLRKIHFKLVLILLGTGIIEHFLYFIKMVVAATSKGDDFVQSYFVLSYSQLFTIFPYSWPVGIIFEFVNLVAAVVWQFMSYLLIIFSIALVHRFRQINITLKAIKVVDDQFLEQLKRDYAMLSVTCVKLDEAFSGVILVIFTGGFYFLCALIFEGSNDYTSITGILFYYFNGLFYCFHIFGVIYFPSWIYEESLPVLEFLNSLPTRHYKKHIEPMQNQIEVNPARLTVANLVGIRKNLAFKMVNAIMSCQLILIQFESMTK